MVDFNYSIAPVLHKAGPCMLMPSRMGLRAAYVSDAESLSTSKIVYCGTGLEADDGVSQPGAKWGRASTAAAHCPCSDFGGKWYFSKCARTLQVQLSAACAMSTVCVDRTATTQKPLSFLLEQQRAHLSAQLKA